MKNLEHPELVYIFSCKIMIEGEEFRVSIRSRRDYPFLPDGWIEIFEEIELRRPYGKQIARELLTLLSNLYDDKHLTITVSTEDIREY